MICPSCGTGNRAGARFCDACGTPLAARPADEVVARKVVTIVFADLIGSTALHEQLDAESVRGVMDRYYRALHGAVDAHGGTVVKLLGDGVMAAFGVPRVAEDDAIRAVRAAWAMQAAGRELVAAQRAVVADLGLRVAVNTGEVVVSADNADVVGDPVNVAARLQEAARDGEVLVGESTRRLVTDLVTLAPIGALALKGRSESVAAYRVVSLERPATTAATTFVGRDDELARLQAAQAATIAERRPRLAVVLGSPGLGKSRLLAELARRLAATTTVLAARCEGAGSATFAPLAEALRQHLGLADGADAVRTASALPADEADTARVAAGIAALLAGAPAPAEETFFVVRRLLAALAARRPLLLAIDDAQWAAPLLLDLAEHLVQWSGEAPLLVLLAARPELREVRAALTVPGPAIDTVLTLTGLDAAAATRLAANVVGADALPAAVAGRVLAASEGNPLFVGELVRMLVHDGTLRREGERWTSDVEPAALEMPPTIHALLAARIERLGAGERQVLERAAVIGRSFSRRAVAALLPDAGSDLDTHLATLQRSELIEPDGGLSLGEPALRFHHALIRDAAYRRLLKGTRAELHGRFADWIEARAGGAAEHDEVIGFHLEQAHEHLIELGPPDASTAALGARAAAHLAAAGRRALARDDLAVAVALLTRAIARLGDADPVHAELILDQCEALLAAGDVAAAAPAVAALGRLTTDDRGGAADRRRRLQAWHICFAGQLAALTEPQMLRATADAVATAAETLAALGDAAGEAKGHAVHAAALARLGAIGASEAALDRALAAARRGDDRRRANAVLAGAPVAALWGPSPVTRASGRCLDVVRVLRITQGAPAVEAVALRCQAVLEALRGRTAAARRMLASSRRLVEELGITHRLLEADVFAGLIELLEGSPATAEPLLRHAYDGLRAQGLGIDAARAAALLGRALLAQDRLADAEALSHASEALAGDDLQAAIAWRGVRAEALARRGEAAAAVAIARAAVDVAAATDALLDHADARLALSVALRAAGADDEAAAEERRALELWEAKGATLLSQRFSAARAAPPTLVRPHLATEPIARLDADDAARAVARGAGRATPPQWTNTAMRVQADYARRWQDRDWPALLAMLAPDVELEDHRSVVHLPLDGTTFRENLRFAFDVPDNAYEVECLASRGERLALHRTRFEGRPLGVAMREEYLTLVALDADSRVRSLTLFDVADLEAAYAALDDRFAAGEGAAHAALLADHRAWIAAIRARDWDAATRLLADDLVVTSHRRFGGTEGVLDRTAYVASLRNLGDLDVRFAMRIHHLPRLAAHAAVAVSTIDGTLLGGTFEQPTVSVWIHDGRRPHALEIFDGDQLDAALARFDAITAAPPAAAVSTLATRARARIAQRWRARDWPGVVACYAADTRLEDRRPVVRLDLDTAAFFANLRLMFDAPDSSLDGEPLATRGDHLALFAGGFRTRLEDGAAVSVDNLTVIEVDEAGRVRRVTQFAPEDGEAARAELDARFAAAEGARFPHVLASMEVFRRAFLERDWAALTAHLSPALAMHDHRPLGWEPTYGPEPYVEALRGLVALAPDVRLRVDHAAICARGYLSITTWAGTHHGGLFEAPSVIVGALDDQARPCRFDQYELSQIEEARAAFATLADRPAAAAPAAALAIPANAATRVFDRIRACRAAGDWDGLRALHAPDLTWEDRRPLFRAQAGIDAMITTARLIARERMQVSHAALAVAGERLSLEHIRLTRAGDDAFEIELLQLAEVDGDGRIAAIVYFDPTDRRAAADELADRYAAGEGAAQLPAAAFAAMRAVRARDLVALRRLVPDDFTIDDRRRTGLGRIDGADAYLESLRALFALAPDVSTEVLYQLAIDRCGTLVMARMSGTFAGGGAFETVLLRLTVFRDGLWVRAEFFEVDDLATAQARYLELVAPPPNAAARARIRIAALFEAADWTTLRAMAAPDFRYEDRRRSTPMTGGGDVWVDSMRTAREADARPHYELIGTFGDRVSVERAQWRGTSDAGGTLEMEHLSITVLDLDGRVAAALDFDRDDRAAAFAEAHARFVGLT